MKQLEGSFAFFTFDSHCLRSSNHVSAFCSCRQRGLGEITHVIDGNKRTRACDEVSGAIPVPEANAELQPNLNRLRMMSDAKAKSKSDKLPPPHQDAAHLMHLEMGLYRSAQKILRFVRLNRRSSRSPRSITSKSGTLRSRNDEEPQRAPARSFMNALYPSSTVWDFGFSRRRTGLENGRDRR